MSVDSYTDIVDDNATTSASVHTFGGPLTESAYVSFDPPRDCCAECEVNADRVRVLFWPVDDVDNQTTTAHNISKRAVASPYTEVSDGFTFTSPSVYVVYENIYAITDCFEAFDTFAHGPSYNTTVAYNPGDLSTSVCHWGAWRPMNYTEMQYPPPNSELPGCYVPGYGSDGNPTRVPETIAAHPIFSYPSNVISLNSAWTTCTPGLFGAYDPPKTLSKATAMAPPVSSTLPAAPAATAVPEQAPATPTPTVEKPQDPQDSPQDPKSDPQNDPQKVDPQGDPPRPPSSPVDIIPSAQPEPNPENGNRQQPSPSGIDTPNHDPANIDNPPSEGNPFSDDPNFNTGSPSNDQSPSNNNPGSNNNPQDGPKSPSDDRPTNSPTNDPGNDHSSPSNGNPSIKNPGSQSGSPSNNDNPSSNDPANNKDPQDDPKPSNENQPQNDPSSNGPDIFQPSNAQEPFSKPVEAAASYQGQNLGGLIASAFGYGPKSAIVPATGAPNLPTAIGDPRPGNAVAVAPAPLSIIVNGVTTALPSNVGQASNAQSINVEGHNVPFSQGPSHIIIGGQTVAPGGAAITVSDVPISLPSPQAPAGELNAPPPAAAAPVYTIGGQAFTANPTQMVVGGSTIQVGGPAATVAGTPVRLQSSGGLVIGASTFLAAPAVSPPAQIPPPIYTVGDEIFTANPTGIAINGNTITPGGPGMTIAGTPVVLQPSGGIVIGGSTFQAVPTASGVPEGSALVYTIGDQAITANPTVISIAGTTITPGGSGVTIAGTSVLLQSSGGLVIRGSTVPVSPSASNPAGGASAVPGQVYTIGNQVFTANPTAISLAGTTVIPGASGITIAGTPISLQTSGVLIIGSSTVSVSALVLTPTPAGAATTTSPQVYTVGGQIFTANPTAVSLAGTTIVPGGSVVTISGAPVSLQKGGSLVVGSSTVAEGSRSQSERTTVSPTEQSSVAVGSSSRSVGTSAVPTGQGNRRHEGLFLAISASFVVVLFTASVYL